MPEKFKNKYTIKSARLQGYDYSQNGLYFVTICTKDKEYFLGEIANREMILSEVGKIAQQFWQEIPEHFPFVKIDEFVVMSNHVHGILEILRDETNDVCDNGNRNCTVETQQCCVSTLQPRCVSMGALLNKKISNTFYQLKPVSLSVIIRSFKSIVSKTANKKFPNVGFNWQSRFHDHVIHNEIELNKIREYIRANPAMWERDRNNEDDIFIT